MTTTNLNNLLVNGVPTLGVNGLPVPFTGNYYYVKPYSGADGNDGQTPQTAFKTVSHALSVCVSGNNDVVFLVSESNTAANTTDYQSATLTWNKDLTHLVGIAAPSQWSNRARIAQLSTATGISPLMNITGNGCYFANFSVFQGVADATSLIAVQVTGSRNVFNNVGIFGIGNATQVTAGAMSLKLNGAAENTFVGCTIGLDTISRDQNCTEMTCASSASRNYFLNCLFDAYVSNAGYAFVTVGANGIDRNLVFDNCMFSAKSTNKTITLTSAFSIPAISQGAIQLKGGTCGMSDGGAFVWDSASRGIIWNSAVAAAASAGGGKMTNL